MTAVEWFAEKIGHNSLISLVEYNELFEQAKEMEKEQMIEFAKNCLHEDDCFFVVEQYYNETFK